MTVDEQFQREVLERAAEIAARQGLNGLPQKGPEDMAKHLLASLIGYRRWSGPAGRGIYEQDVNYLARILQALGELYVQ